MKAIEARDQVRLSAGKCFALALSGMSYRLFRSAVTVAILGLAVAFLVHTVSYELMSRVTQHSAYQELSQDRKLGQQLTRLGKADTASAVIDSLVDPDAQLLAEYQRFAGLTAQDLAWARRAAQTLRQAVAELDDLPTAARAVLLGDRSAERLLQTLSAPAQLQAFDAQVRTLGIPYPLGDRTAFGTLVETTLPALMKLSRAIVSGHDRAVAELSSAYPGKSVIELLSEPPAELLTTAQRVGFGLDQRDMSELSAFALRSTDLKTLNRLSQHSGVRAAVARETAVPLTEVSLDTLAQHVTSGARAEWLHTTLHSALRASGEGLELGSSAIPNSERILQTLSRYRREQQLSLVARGPSDKASYWGLEARTLWLITLSFLVCAVGVANAMLMSVTERFTEIATMKCLGAMDWFVMMMFVFEAAIQGALGGVIGIVLGTVLAVLRGAFEFGSLFTSAAGAAGETLLAAAVSFAVAILLAAVAAVGPAYIAARLPPMEAMRVD